MKTDKVILSLKNNTFVIEGLLAGIPNDQQKWRPQENKWCILEILCHLIDEERYDFRKRVQHLLENPGSPPPSIDPVAWVVDHRYMEQDYDEKLKEWKTERNFSLSYLRGLENPEWNNSYQHPKLGELSARFFLDNWLAHDYLHIRQINRTLFQYLQDHTEEDLNYAGSW